jgi:hypothetical protein
MDPREPILKGVIKLFAVECRKVRDGKLGLCLSLSLEREGRGGAAMIFRGICVYFPNEVVKFLSCSFVLLMWGLSGRCARCPFLSRVSPSSPRWGLLAKATTIRMSVSLDENPRGKSFLLCGLLLLRIPCVLLILCLRFCPRIRYALA